MSLERLEMGDAKKPKEPEHSEQSGAQGAYRGRRRQRRRAGAPAKNFAQSRTTRSSQSVRYHDESPDDIREFDVAYWKNQRPPHWG